MNRIFFIFLMAVFIVLPVFTPAQNTAVYRSPQADYELGTELFYKEKYGAAREIFERVISKIENPNSRLRINATYYDAVCALELFNKDAEYKLKQFTIYYPSDTKVHLAFFQLGRLAYRNRKYKKALEYFQKTDISELSPSQKGEYHFKTGYCYFKAKDYPKAKSSFDKAIGFNSKYASPSKYYLAHLAYENGDYETALKGFEELTADPNFKAIVPYYLIQIYFLKGEYSKVTGSAPGLLENAPPKRKPDIERILGESYYKLAQYDKALEYMERFAGTARSKMSREDKFILGFLQFQNKNFDKAIKNLQQATTGNDSLSQYAWYYLASCYLHTDRKKFAANAFKEAFDAGFDKEIAEDALFNYAKISYDISFDPYNSAIKALKQYLLKYPNSSKNDEAYYFLYKISIATGKYEEAISALEKIKNKNPSYEQDLQKSFYLYATSLFNKGDYETAAEYFKRAAGLKKNAKIEAKSLFWLGESYYRLDNYQMAYKYYRKFLDMKASKSLPLYYPAFYNTGYVYFNNGQYANAVNYFRKFLKSGDINPKMKADAMLRTGDSYFAMKRYGDAIAYYDKAAALNEMDLDYALYQKAIALGVLSRYDEKTATLRKLVSAFPGSPLYGKALYELGNTYLITNNNEKALLSFKKLISSRPTGPYSIKAQLKSGLIYYNGGQNDLALKTFKKIVETYPDSPQAKEALASIRNIYIDLNKTEEYFDYVSNLSFTKITPSEQDSVMYVAAENRYLDENLPEAIASFKKYLKKFPNGAYNVKARFYLAESLFAQGNKTEALPCYDSVLNNGDQELEETALYKSASIYFENNNFEKASERYLQLEKITDKQLYSTLAQYRLMKCFLELKDYEQALVYANKLLTGAKLDTDKKLEAMMVKAKAFQSAGELALAENTYLKIVKLSKNIDGAEAEYNIALIQYQLKDYDKAEKTVFELSNQYGAFDYWVAKGFVLLGDIYTKTGNLFQAKQTLQSIVDNYEGDDLKAIAKEKIEKIEQSERNKKAEIIENDSLMNQPDTITIKG